MPLSQAQRYQFNLLGVPDSAIGADDRFALAGVVQSITELTELTEAQRYQLNLLGVPNSSFGVGDRYALAGVVQTQATSAANVQTFTVTWVIDPTHTGYLLPQSNDGSLDIDLQGVAGALLGSVNAPYIGFPAITATTMALNILSATGALISPISMARQTVETGIGRMLMTLVFGNLQTADYAQLLGWLAEMNGTQRRAQVSVNAENQGDLLGIPRVNGADQVGTSLNIDGARTSITDWIVAGDVFTVNDELKVCTANANSNASGEVTISFQPRIRRSPRDDDPIYVAPYGVFILSRSAQFGYRADGTSIISFDLLEDIAA